MRSTLMVMNKQFLMSLLATVITATVSVSAVLMTARVTGPLPVAVSQTVTDQNQPFQVTGRAELSAIPNQAEVSLGVTTEAASVAQAQSETNQVINGLTDRLRQLGIGNEDIATSNYSINPQYSFRTDESNQITGYTVNASVRVTTDNFELLNQIIDQATSLGINQVNSVQFSLSTEQREQLRAQAREEAINDAKNSARELARLTGVQLGKIKNVIESGNNQPTPQPMLRMDTFALTESAPTQLEPGSSEFLYSVTLSYETF